MSVDHECRPYELGWLLYAWLPTPTDRRTRSDAGGRPWLRPTTHRELVFGLPIDPLTLDQTLELAESARQEQKRLLVGVVNAAKIDQAQGRPGAARLAARG